MRRRGCSMPSTSSSRSSGSSARRRRRRRPCPCSSRTSTSFARSTTPTATSPATTSFAASEACSRNTFELRMFRPASAGRSSRSCCLTRLTPRRSRSPSGCAAPWLPLASRAEQRPPSFRRPSPSESRRIQSTAQPPFSSSTAPTSPFIARSSRDGTASSPRPTILLHRPRPCRLVPRSRRSDAGGARRHPAHRPPFVVRDVPIRADSPRSSAS